MVGRFGTCLVALFGLFFNDVRGQDTLPPTQGGYVHSLGLPAIYKPFFGIGLGLSHNRTDHLAAQFRTGVFKDIGSPITELVGWSVEGFAGVRDLDADYGARAFLLSHLLGMGAGLEYDVRDGRGSPLLLLQAPMRRGGLLGIAERVADVPVPVRVSPRALHVDGDEFEVEEGSVIRVDPAGARCITADSQSPIRYICVQTEAKSLVQFTESDGVILETKPSWLPQAGA